MNNTFAREGNVSNGANVKDLSSWWAVHTSNLDTQPIPRIFVICDQRDTAPVWGYILSQQGLSVILEARLEKATDRWCMEMPELGVIDISSEHQDRIELFKRFRAVSAAPVLLFLPAHDEKQILEAYSAGVDEVVVKPISPAIFLAKIMTWVRRSYIAPRDKVIAIHAGRYQLNSARRCLIDPDGLEIKLTDLEFRLLNLLMSRAEYIFSAEDIIQAIWGRFRRGDQILLTNVVYRLRKKIEADPSYPRHLQRWQGGYSFHS